MSDDEGGFGPPLPPHLAEQRRQQQQQRGPAGPQMPPEVLQALREGRDVSALLGAANDADADEDGADDDGDGDDGPIGPHVPKELLKRRGPGDDDERAAKRPPHADDSDDDGDVVGPLPSMVERPEDREDAAAEAAREIEERAERMRAKLRGEDQPVGSDKPQRGEWMLKLPPRELNVDNLRPRTFMSREYKPDEDTSVWTDTPEEKARKRAEAKDPTKRKTVTKEDAEQPRISKRDQELAERIKEHNEKKRPKSLLDEYKEGKHMTQRMTTVDDPSARGFDRDKDLTMRRMDPAKRRELIESAASVSSRFHNATRGSTYL